MYEKTGNRTTARILIALLAVALVFTMMPLSMGKAFAAENTTVSGLTVTGDVTQELKYDDMKAMKNDEAIKAVTKKDVVFYGINRVGTPAEATVDGVTLEDLIAIAGLPAGTELIGVEAESTGAKPGTKMYPAQQIITTDLKGNKMMFAWKWVEEGKEAKVQTTVRGQFSAEDVNRSDWYTDVTKLTVKALNKPTVKVKAGKKKATVKWTADTDAEQFVVLRSTKKGSGFKAVKTLDNTKTSFTDKKVKKGKTYFYKVQAVAGDVTNLSAAKKVKVK